MMVKNLNQCESGVVGTQQPISWSELPLFALDTADIKYSISPKEHVFFIISDREECSLAWI